MGGLRDRCRTLWLEMEARSIFISSTSMGIFPAICAMSEWKNTCERTCVGIGLG